MGDRGDSDGYMGLDSTFDPHYRESPSLRPFYVPQLGLGVSRVEQGKRPLEQGRSLLVDKCFDLIAHSRGPGDTDLACCLNSCILLQST